jgi:hypothetical protein
VLLAVAAGCAPAARPAVVAVRLPRSEPPPLATESGDPEVLSAVAWFVTQRVGLPLPLWLHAHFFPSQDAFEQGLVARARVDADIAREQARFATGVGTAEGMFLRGDRLAGAPLHVRVGLYAHELTHVSQYELAGGRRGASEQWLREGFADWVRYQALDHFRVRPYAESRRRAIREVRQWGAAARLPALGVLVSNRQWTAARTQWGAAATYGQAFLAADWLVERAGRERVVEYFRRFGRSDDRAAHFREVFGMPPGQFHVEFRTRLASLL